MAKARSRSLSSIAKVLTSRIDSASPDDFEYMEQIGAGSFGKVYKVTHKATGEVCAMKILLRSKLESANLMKYAITERNVMSYVRHPYIVSLRYAFQTDRQFVLVMSYCPGGNMQQLLKKEKQLSLPLARHYSAEVLLALEHLHESKILYRDLKLENIVLDDARHATLTDFGLSKEGVEMYTGNLAKSFLGSICFLAPEILERAGHNHTVDVYGLGVLLHAMVTGTPPFFDTNRQKMWSDIRKAKLVVPNRVSKDAASLIEVTMKRKPSERLGATRTADVRTHKFFASVNFEELFRREVPVPELRRPPSQTLLLDPKKKRLLGSKTQRRAIFGRTGCCSRMLNCTPQVRPVQDWDYECGGTEIDPRATADSGTRVSGTAASSSTRAS